MASNASLPDPALNSAGPLTDDVSLRGFRPSSQGFTSSSLLSRSWVRISKWKLVEYCREQPATTLCLLSLILLTLFTPLLSLYIQHYGQKLPDLDTMKVWNHFLGKLSSKLFCSISGSGKDVLATANATCSGKSCHTVGVVVEFLVGVELVKLGVPAIVGNFTGKDFKTKIKDRNTRERIDGNISYSIFIDMQDNNCTQESYCNLNGCVLITGPDSANNFNQLYNSSAFPLRPSPDRLCSPSDTDHNQTDIVAQEMFLIGSDSCNDLPTSVKLARGKYSRYGLVFIFLSDDDLKLAGSRLYFTTTVLLGLTIMFIIGISCTDRHKSPLMAYSK